MKIIKRLFCKHKNQKFIRNIYGDEINRVSSAKQVYRSIYQCQDCGAIIYHGELHK